MRGDGDTKSLAASEGGLSGGGKIGLVFGFFQAEQVKFPDGRTTSKKRKTRPVLQAGHKADNSLLLE